MLSRARVETTEKYRTPHPPTPTSLLFTKGAGSRGAGQGYPRDFHLISFGLRPLPFPFPFIFLASCPSPSVNPLHPSLRVETPKSSCRGVCVPVCDQDHCCSFAHVFSMYSAQDPFFNRRTGHQRLRQDGALPFCALLDGTSVDESWAPYLGLTGERKHCTHICSHAHFLLHPPPWYPSHSRRTPSCSNTKPFHTSTFPKLQSPLKLHPSHLLSVLLLPPVPKHQTPPNLTSSAFSLSFQTWPPQTRTKNLTPPSFRMLKINGPQTLFPPSLPPSPFHTAHTIRQAAVGPGWGCPPSPSPSPFHLFRLGDRSGTGERPLSPFPSPSMNPLHPSLPTPFFPKHRGALVARRVVCVCDQTHSWLSARVFDVSRADLF